MKEFKDFDSSKISWFRCGGKIDVFCIVENINELNEVLNKYKNVDILPIGAGSNILIRDGGFHGIAIKFAGDFNKIEIIDNNKIKAGSGVLCSTLSKFATENNLIGIEFLSTIPGTVGGIIKMNAGCFDSETKDVLIETTLLTNGEIKVLKNEDLQFSYRYSNLKNSDVVLSGLFQVKNANEEEIKQSKKTLEEMQEHRKNNQIVGATCGSTFTNPTDKDGKKLSAWKLIDEVGLRGYQIGGAKFSEKHCNFIINNGSAKAEDIENLIKLAQEKVKNKFDIDLNCEIKIV